MIPSKTIALFDEFLAERNLSLEAVLVGGAALALLGVIARETRDCDVLHPELPEAITTASVAFAAKQRANGDELDDEWLNNGPAQLTEVLPSDWPTRLQEVFVGKALRLTVLGRPDFLKTKLFALCDRGIDRADCLALAPSAVELVEATPWLHLQDGHPGWPDHVDSTLSELREALEHGI